MESAKDREMEPEFQSMKRVRHKKHNFYYKARDEAVMKSN
jgi:hypothetical protein